VVVVVTKATTLKHMPTSWLAVKGSRVKHSVKFLPFYSAVCFQLQKLGHLLRVGGSSTTQMHGQIMQLVARAAIKVLYFTAIAAVSSSLQYTAVM